MAFTTFTSATDLVLCQFRVDPDPSQTYAHALSAGVIYEAYGDRPPDGTYWADVGLSPARDTYLDFANNELSAAHAPYFYTNRYGGKIFQVSGDTEPVYVGRINYNVQNDEAFAVLSSGQLLSRGDLITEVTSAHRADRAYILPTGESLSALIFSFGFGSSYTNLYLCVEDDDDTLLASTIDHETRTGVNDILLYSVSASPASTTIPLTGFSNAEAGQEIILKAVFNYTTSATQPPYLSLEELLHQTTWYSGYKNRSTWYTAGDWQTDSVKWKGCANISATSAIAYNDEPPAGIAHFMIKDDGSFLLENWTAGEYNDFDGAITTPVLDFTTAAEEITSCVHAPAITLFVTQPVSQENQNVLVQTSITNGESATSYDWDWGDGNFTISGDANEEHAWSGMTIPTSYTISVTAHGAICGTGTANASIDVWPTLTTATTTECVLTADYVELCGQAVARFGACRQIDLTSFLPDYVREHDTLQFTQFFEDFLNTLYAGACGVTISTSAYSEASGTSGAAITANINVDDYTYTEPTIVTTTDSCNVCSAWDQTRTISILEKIFRLTETHDPELIDLEFIQFFASNLGYDVSVNRQEMGNLGESTSGDCSEINSEKYLRFMVENLPNWYKIKTTQNAIKVMLFSFGLVGDILNYYTRDYRNDWRLSHPEYYTSGTGESMVRENLDTIPDSWYPTPHFSVWFDVRRSNTNFSFNTEKQNTIIRAIDSIRPLNTVFEGVQAYIDGVVHSYARGISRIRKYIQIPNSDNKADWYGWVNPL